jgi:hypothetical protein
MNPQSKKLIDTPAFADGRNQGLTIRQYACIHLKLPLTGDRGLDRIIAIAQRRDLVAQISAGILAKKFDDKDDNLNETIKDALEYSESIINGISGFQKEFNPSAGTQL